MNDLLANPAVQGGVIPFIVAFLLALSLIRFEKWVGLSVVGGFLVMVMLTTGIEFSPLTSTRKIVLTVLILAISVPLLQLARPSLQRMQVLVVVASVGLVLWLIWPYLGRQETNVMLVTAAGMSVFAAWMGLAFLSLNNVNLLASGAAIAATGFGVGGATLLGASALLGQMGISFAVSGMALITAALLSGRHPLTGYVAVLISGISLTMIASSGVIYAKLPWYTLIAIAAIPILAKIGLSNDQKPWLRAAIWFGICMVPALLAIGLSWKSEGDMLY